MADGSEKRWSRRDFLAGAAVGLGGALAASALGRTRLDDTARRPPL